MLDRGGESMRCIAAYHAGELGLVSMRPRLEALRRDSPSFFLGRVLERTLLDLGSRGAGVARA